MHHSLAALARCGNNLIVDHLLIEGEEPETWLTERLTLLSPFDVFFVGVHCSLDELERREQARGDRPTGLARWQIERMHRRTVYDFEVDTSVLTTQECAAQIVAALTTSSLEGIAATLKMQGEVPNGQKG